MEEMVVVVAVVVVLCGLVVVSKNDPYQDSPHTVEPGT